MDWFLVSPLPLQYFRPQGYQPMQSSRWHWQGDHIEAVSAQRGNGDGESPMRFVSGFGFDGNFFIDDRRFISDAPGTEQDGLEYVRNENVRTLYTGYVKCRDEIFWNVLKKTPTVF